MEIIKKTEGLTSADLYALTKGNDVRKMADAKGEVLDVLKYVLYRDEDVKGNEMVVLAVETVDGAKYATNSKTFTRNFTWKDDFTLFLTDVKTSDNSIKCNISAGGSSLQLWKKNHKERDKRNAYNYLDKALKLATDITKPTNLAKC